MTTTKTTSSRVGPGTIRAVARGAGLILAALSTGVLFGTRTALSPSTRTFTSHTYVEVQQATIGNVAPVMGPLLPAAVATNAAVTALTPRAPRAPFVLTLAGTLGQLAALAVTAAVELPINARVATWSPDDPPRGWERDRDRWETAHTARTTAAVAGLAALIAATQVPSAGGPITYRPASDADT